MEILSQRGWQEMLSQKQKPFGVESAWVDAGSADRRLYKICEESALCNIWRRKA